MKKYCAGLSKSSSVVFWILKACDFYTHRPWLRQSKHICFFSSPSCSEDVLRDNTHILSSTFRQDTAGTSTHFHSWLITLKIQNIFWYYMLSKMLCLNMQLRPCLIKHTCWIKTGSWIKILFLFFFNIWFKGFTDWESLFIAPHCSSENIGNSQK